ncbi:MAG TPA: twin transmembrane helix small protein [Devosiaceae bacterium]|nr:twin transmembrane helix small protein [Devosiaceae bacterium]
MQLALNILIGIAMAAAAIIVLLGFFNMVRGGSGNMSQKLMRARVIAQAVAIALLLAALYFFGGNHGGTGS